MNNSPLPVTHTVSGNKLVLGDLGRKMAAGHEFSGTENRIAITSTAIEYPLGYGPGPSEMQVKNPPLPENVKGALADAMG
ncbi:MAG: hypothetical protein IK079_05275 [Desulfovibrio sp.]|nr:hypothetical protein [Desulfovibrio sp.]